MFVNAVRGSLPEYSGWFVAALACAVAMLVVGTFAFVRTWVVTPDPEAFHKAAIKAKESKDPEVSYQRTILDNASKAFKANQGRLEWKARAADAVAVLLLGELALLAIWVFTGV